MSEGPSASEFDLQARVPTFAEGAGADGGGVHLRNLFMGGVFRVPLPRKGGKEKATKKGE